METRKRFGDLTKDLLVLFVTLTFADIIPCSLRILCRSLYPSVPRRLKLSLCNRCIYCRLPLPAPPLSPVALRHLWSPIVTATFRKCGNIFGEFLDIQLIMCMQTGELHTKPFTSPPKLTAFLQVVQLTLVRYPLRIFCSAGNASSCMKLAPRYHRPFNKDHYISWLMNKINFVD